MIRYCYGILEDYTKKQELKFRQINYYKVCKEEMIFDKMKLNVIDSVQARLAAVRELDSATGEELSALLPSVLDRAFKGEL